MGLEQLPDGRVRLMAYIQGPGIDQKASYQAVEVCGVGLFKLEKQPAPEPNGNEFFSVKISRQTVRKIGRHKLPGESLPAAVERLILAGLTALKT